MKTFEISDGEMVPSALNSAEGTKKIIRHSENSR